MATTSDVYKIPKLSSDNYHAWAIRSRAALVQKSVWEAIDPGYGPSMTDEERKTNEKALTFLFLVVEDEYLDDIGDIVRAKEAWETLEEINTRYGLLHIIQLLKDFFNVRVKKDEPIKNYLARLMELHRKLVKCGYNFSDREVALIMLMGLPEPYEPLIMNLEHEEDDLNTRLVKSRLLVEEKRLRRRAEEREKDEDEETKAFVVKSHKFGDTKVGEQNFPGKKDFRKPKYGDKWPSKRTTVCYCCGILGHIARNCTRRNDNEKEERKKDASDLKAKKVVINSKALYAGKTTNTSSEMWYLDTGATDHMSSSKEKFTEFRKWTSSVEAANKEKMQVEGVGRVELNIVLQDVLYVPDLDGNLLSLGRIEEMGCKMTFEGGKVQVVDESNDAVILTAKRTGRLYPVKEQNAMAMTARLSGIELWHRRLGHANVRSIQEHPEVNELDVGEFRSNSDERCAVCMKGKMRATAFPKDGATRATEVLELIHSDVVGKIHPISKGGSQYFVTFIDDYSRHMEVYFMKSKDEVMDKFDQFRRVMENLHNKRVKTLRSDNGGEYKGNISDEYFKKHGIQRQYTVPYTPQQNGVAERANQTLLAMTRCLLIESGLPKAFWADALHTACYIRNKCPTAANKGAIPNCLWDEKIMNIDHLRVYGCRVWAALKNKSKLDPRAVECVLIGYPEGVKGYKLWDFRENKIFISRNVAFEENSFPLKLADESENDVALRNDGGVIITFEENLDELSNDKTTPEETDDSDRSTDNEVPFQGRSNSNYGLFSDDVDDRYEIDRTLLPLEPLPEPPKRSRRIAEKSDFQMKCKSTRAEDETKNDDPLSVEEAMSSPDAEMWKQAMEEEIKNLQEKQTWDLVDRPSDRKVIGAKWVFKKKYDKDGNTDRYRARLVAKGYSQIPGIDYLETFSPVVKLKTIRILLALAVEWDWDVHQLDIVTAYLIAR